MDTIRIIPDGRYRGEGISQGLARGLLVYFGDCNLTGEGMGIGSVALRNPVCTCFSRSWSDSSEAGVLKRTFSIDTRMSWCILGNPSTLLTRLIEYGIGAYMKVPRFQSTIMMPVQQLCTLLGISPLFETIPPRGMVTFSYRITENQVDVQVEINGQFNPQDTLCLLNELSAEWFTGGWDGKHMVPPPPGWEKVSSSRLPVSLVDPVHGIRFSLSQLSVSTTVPFTMFCGRENNGDTSWAGFCIELGTLDNSREYPEVRYSVSFVQGAGS
jgi:hypothetical protein